MRTKRKTVLESEQKDFAECVRINRQKLSSELGTRFDYIAVGVLAQAAALAKVGISVSRCPTA